MEHIRDIRGDARHNARRRAGECRDKKRAFGQSVDSHLTMLCLYRGPSASAAALERVLIRTLRPSGNRVLFGPPAVPKLATDDRGRTPPWHRVPTPLLMRHLDPIASIVSRLPVIMRRAELDAVRDSRKRELITAVTAGSKVFYRRSLDELLLTGTMGPVPLSKGLAVALMSDPRGPPDPESLFRGERDVYAGIRLAKNIVRPVIRARTLRRLHGVIKTWNLPPHRRRVVKVPAEIPRAHVRKFLLDHLADLRCARPACFAWVWEQTVFTSTRKCTFSSVSWGAIAACKKADTDCLLQPSSNSTGDVIGAGSAPSREVAKSSAGSGTMSGAGKDQRYWKFECVRSGDTLEKALRCLVCDWRTTVPGVHLPLRQREVQRFMCSLPSCDKGSEFGAYTLGMDQPPSAGRIWAPDDKARTMAWDVSEKDYLLAGFKQMARDTMHWKMVPDSPEIVAEFYEGLHGLVGRKERLYLSRKKKWTGSIVPYTYCTIKSKCHDQSAERRGRTCQKPGHSCMRKIISWWHHPARPQLRAAGRAAAAWIECLHMSWECASMKTSCSDLRKSWLRACRMAGGGHCRSHCRLCGKRLHSPTVYTADAAQFYEEVRGSDILETLQHLLQYSEQRGIHSVMLRESRRRHAYLSKKKHVTREHWKCWPVRRIVALLHLCLSQPFATFGNSVWMQRQGVPIGGLVSGALCSVLLGFAEFRCKTMELEGARVPGYVPPCTARLRYVDDQVWISATDCHDCVEKQLCEVYPKGVQFSPTSNGTNKAEWLDIVVKMESDGTLDLSPKKPELEWVRDPDVPCGRHLVPPFVSCLSLDWTLLRGMVKCRCARLLQMRLTKQALRGALQHEVQVWRRSGYDSRLITQLWSRLWKYPDMEKYVCAYIAGHRPRI